MRSLKSSLLPAALTSVCAGRLSCSPLATPAASKVAFVTAAAVRSPLWRRSRGTAAAAAAAAAPSAIFHGRSVRGLRSSRQQQWQNTSACCCFSVQASWSRSSQDQDLTSQRQPWQAVVGHQAGGWAAGASALPSPMGRRQSSAKSTSDIDGAEILFRENDPDKGLSNSGMLAPWPPALLPAGTGNGRISLSGAVKQAARWLELHGVVDPEPSASELLAKALGFRSPQDMLEGQRQNRAPEMSAAAWDEFRRLCRLRAAQHVPVQYLVGEWDFYGLSLEMEPPTLIPRPETEELVERILGWLHKEVVEDTAAVAGDGGDGGGKGGNGGAQLRFLDVGSGTGAIGLALLRELPAGAQCVAVDARESAVRLSRRNAVRTGLQARYSCFHAKVAELGVGTGGRSGEPGGEAGEIYRRVRSRASRDRGGVGRAVLPLDLDGSFDFVVSNPPYIPRRDMDTLPRDVADHEDRVALDGGEDGLDVIRDIVRRCPRLLRRGGPRQLWMEVDISHPEAIQRWLGLPIGSGGEDMKGEGQECHSHGVSRFEWMRDMSQRPRFVRLTFAEEDAGEDS